MEVPPVRYKELADEAGGEKSGDIKSRVNRAREIQMRRFKGTPINSNSQMTPTHVKKYAKPDEAGNKLLETAIDKLGLSVSI